MARNSSRLIEPGGSIWIALGAPTETWPEHEIFEGVIEEGKKKPRGSPTEYHSGNQTHPGIERAPGAVAIKLWWGRTANQLFVSRNPCPKNSQVTDQVNGAIHCQRHNQEDKSPPGQQFYFIFYHAPENTK